MATLADVEAHQALVEDLSAVAIADLVDLWDDLPADPEAARRILQRELPDLVDAYAPITSAQAADFYDELRSAAEAPGAFRAQMVNTPPVEASEALAGWSASGLYVDRGKALSQAAGGLQRLIVGADRRTIERNVGRDRSGPRFARHASANACAFCAMVATRGAVYRSEDAAGSKYHDHCHCVAVPVWNPRAYEEAPYVAEWRSAYYDATTQLGAANDPKAILKLMRKSTGLR